MSVHDYENDYENELVEAPGNKVALKRMEDVIPDEDYVLHDFNWWMVTGEVGETGALELSLIHI